MPFDLYSEVTNQIIAMLEQGVAPWRSPILGQGTAGHPHNLISQKPYRGVNVFLLAFSAWTKGYESSYWLTFNQARQRGGLVKRGEQSSIVVFWKPYETTDRESGDKVTVPVLRYYRVFNISQCTGIASSEVVISRPLDFQPIQAAEGIVRGFDNAPAIEHRGSQAYYRAKCDAVTLPEPSRFVSGEEYYATLFHELAHSTGHSKRLDRKLDTDPQPFGSPDYGREELVAEMAAAFLSSRAGIHPAVIDNQAAYLSGWLTKLRQDKRLVISAAGAAQKAADWILGLRDLPA